jgi:predicted O-methyltransferase YrrM
MFFFRAAGYLKYKLFARHRKGHGIHSPFIFDLINRTFRNKLHKEVVLLIEKIRKEALRSERIIKVLDLGAGSVKMKGNLRKVSEIARYSSIPEKYGILLSALASRFGNGSIIEYGTSLGISTMYLAAGSLSSTVYTMEGCYQTASVAKENFEKAGFRNICIMNGSFSDQVPLLMEKGIKPGLIFIDGNHSKGPVLDYFSQMAEIAGNDTVIVLDDIHLSDDMEEAWKMIKKWKNVSSTIDIRRMGLVFFRKGMSRIDYIIRY